MGMFECPNVAQTSTFEVNSGRLALLLAGRVNQNMHDTTSRHDRADYVWAREMIETHDLVTRSAAVLMSPTFVQAQGLEILGCKALPPHQLAEWILADGLEVRMQLQMHKFIWDPQARGV